MKILIVDDHPVVISGCKALLAGEADMQVFAASDAEAGFDAFCAHRPDVALVDLNLPGASGFDLTRRLLRYDDQARVVIFSMNDDPAFVARALEAGARGYIAKNDDPALFAGALRQIAAGKAWLPPGMARKLAGIRAIDPLADLTPREWEIVRLLAAGETIGDIADRLGVSPKTIANNCTALKPKLGARSSMELMRAAIEALAGR